MSKIVQLSRRYFNDSEIHDVLANTAMSLRSLQRFGRRRGILAGSDCKPEDLISQIVRAPLIYSDVKILADLLETEPKQLKSTTCRIPIKAESDDIKNAVESVKLLRKPEHESEEYVLEKHGDSWLIKVSYVEIDPEKSPIYQRTLSVVTIEISPEKNDIEVELSNSKRAFDIVNEISKELKKAKKTESDEIQKISLSGITDPALRTKFFTSIPTKMKPDFRLLDILDVSVHRVEDKKNDEGEGLEEEEESAEKHSIKSQIKSAALKGENVLESDIYQNMRGSGYYLTKFVWSAEAINENGLQLVMEASFSDEIDATGLVYDIRKFMIPEEGKHKGLTSKDLLRRLGRSIRKRIASAAYESQRDIENEISKVEAKQQTDKTP